jgi:serine phosphatase RsbU (regulator of sigma subunit)
MLGRTILFVLFCILPTLIQGQARRVIDISQTNIKEHIKGKISYIEDASGKMSVEEVVSIFDKKATYLSDNQANFYQNPSAFWFRFDIKHHDFQKTSWVAEIPYPSLDYVELYYKDRQDKWQVEKSGDRILFKEKTIKSKINVFRLNFYSDSTHTFYIRVQTGGILQIPFNFQEINTFFADTAYEEAFLGVFYGMMLALALYNLFIFFVLLDIAYVYYALYMLLAMVFTGSLIGHTFQYLFFNTPFLIEPVLVLSGSALVYFLVGFIQIFLNTKKELIKGHWALQILKGVALLVTLTFFVAGYTLAIKILVPLVLFTVTTIIIVSVYAMYCKIPASNFLTFAFVSMVVGVAVYALMQMTYLPHNLLTIHAPRFGIGFQGILFSLALADRYRHLRRMLLIQEREAKETLEIKVQQRTEELRALHQELIAQNEELHQTQEEIMAQRDAIEQKNVELATQNEQIQNSIRAARVIQKAIVPYEQKRDELLRDYFVIYRPRDVVSGDFYWMNKIGDTTYLAVIDCTGHGVPGAFMTMMTHNLLDKIVRVWDMYDPAKVLNQMHDEVTTILRQKETDNNYGMDMCFMSNTPQADGTHKLIFAGAKQNGYYIPQDTEEVKVLQGTRKSIGGLQRADIDFENIELLLEKGSQIYLTSDGYLDQNDVKRKRIGEKHFAALLQKICRKDMLSQKEALIKFLYTHMQDTVQRDDILVLGFKLA